MTADYWPITLGAFLVGVGGSCINVSASALIADLVPGGDRGRAIGANHTFAVPVRSPCRC
jgi:MFS family permease